MGQKIGVGFVQFNILNDIEKNILYVEDEIIKLTRYSVDLVVLPELFTSGFNPKVVEKAADVTKEVLDRLSWIAKEHSLSIIGSLPERVGKNIYNTAYVIGSDGKQVSKYRKVHLFPPMGEQKIFSAGKKIVTFRLNGVKFGVAICFDIRFPEQIRKIALDGAKVLIVCAEWPKVRYLHWLTLLRARAIENQIFVIAANACGRTNGQDFLGHSVILNPYGEIVYEAHEFEESVDALIDLSLIEKFRKQFDTISLRKPKVYEDK
ncbi:carbon-nitrogen family hydrolase [Thermodesulfobacteriota bacterium]